MKTNKRNNIDYLRLRQIVEEVVEEKLEEKLGRFPTKEEYNQKMDKMYEQNDKIITMLENREQEDIVGSHQISDHEERITTLEELHPGGKHVVK